MGVIESHVLAIIISIKNVNCVIINHLYFIFLHDASQMHLLYG